MKLRNTALAAALLLATQAGKAQQPITPFKNGDRIAFVGNSITDGGHYHAYVWLYYMTHFPNERITCYNVGIGGDAAKQLARRFKDDALTRNANILFLTWGMNDSGYMDWWRDDAQQTSKARIDTSVKYYQVMNNQLKAHPEIKKILFTESPYDETTTSNPNNLWKGKAGALASIVDMQQQMAKKDGWGWIDLYHPMWDINQREQKTDPKYSLAPNDRVHPDNDGHLVMAYLILKAQGLAGKPVADMELNAASKLPVRQENCQITNVAGSGDGLSFNYLAKSLPYPVDTISRGWGNHKSAAQALKVIPFMQEMNREMLTVKGLKAGSYQLKIDNEVIGKWSADDLAKGINLAEQTTTPQYQQASQIMNLNEERWEIERRLRQHAFMEFNVFYDRHMLNQDDKAAMDTVNKLSVKDAFVNGNKGNYLQSRYASVRNAWQAEMDVLVKQIYAINKPRLHKISLTYTSN